MARGSKKKPASGQRNLSLVRGTLLSIGAILVLSATLALCFNSGSLLGIRGAANADSGLSEKARSVPSVPQAAAAVNLPAPPDVPPSVSFVAPTPTTWNEVRDHLEDQTLLLVDARAKPVFEAGHIPGAVCLPEDSPASALEEFRTEHGTDMHLVIYCASTSCSLSYKLAHKLAQEYGFARVQYLTGGYLEYQRETANTPTVTGESTFDVGSPPITSVAPSTPSVTPKEGPLLVSSSQINPQPMSWAKVDEWIKARQAVLVDVRPATAFQKGHVPGALSLPAESLPDKVAVLRNEQGTNRTLILYGDMAGSMAAFITGRKLMKESGFASVRFVTEGYQEWQKNLTNGPLK